MDIPESALSWLLERSNPSVRYRTLTELLDCSEPDISQPRLASQYRRQRGEVLADLRLVTYCGLYCGLCALDCRIPQRALALRDDMREAGHEYWGQGLPGFKEFWGFLDGLVGSESRYSCRDMWISAATPTKYPMNDAFQASRFNPLP
jgi:hypothetical protein